MRMTSWQYYSRIYPPIASLKMTQFEEEQKSVSLFSGNLLFTVRACSYQDPKSFTVMPKALFPL